MSETPASGLGEDWEVIANVRDWLGAGQRVAWVTLLRTWGSAPRPPGALLAVGSEQGLIGSVSGGCVEERLIERYRAGDWSGRFPLRQEIGVSGDDAARAGLPCGGRLELLVEQLDSGALPTLEPLLAALERSELLARRLCLQTGEISLHPGAPEAPLLQADEQAVTRLFGPAWQLLLIGDGQIARALARMAMMLDYGVTICEPRALFRTSDPLPGIHVSRQMPDDAVRALADHPRAAVVTLAHDPRQDDLALIEALDSRAFYVGALGSRRSAAARVERLTEMGLSRDRLARLDAPAGIAIGGKRPGEIALAILAGITAARNGANTQSRA